METYNQTEMNELKWKVKKLQKIVIFLSSIIILLISLSTSYIYNTVIQANRIEIIDESGNIVQVLDKNGLKASNTHQNQWHQNNNFYNTNMVRFVYKKVGSSSGFVQISTLSGEYIESQNYYSHFDEKIVINNTFEYYFEKNSQKVLFNNALEIGRAENIDKAIDLCLFHYVNQIYQGKN